jgi:hypothetical protein
MTVSVKPMDERIRQGVAHVLGDAVDEVIPQDCNIFVTRSPLQQTLNFLE